jgi:hypothetical protein
MAKRGKKMQTDTKDFMSDILAQSQKETNKGITPKSKKKNSLLDIIGEDELEIIEDATPIKKTTSGRKTGVCKWKDVKGGNDFNVIPPELWTDKKIFSYFRFLCVRKDKSLGDKIVVAIGPALHARFIKKIREELERRLGSIPSNSVLRTYIEWYVNEELSVSSFDLYDICSRRVSQKFMSLNKHKQVEGASLTNKIDLSKIEDSYNSGGVTFLMNYGIVICFSWLLSSRGLSSKESKEVIQSFYQDAAKSGPAFVERIKEVTKKMSPYSEKDYSQQLSELLANLAINEVSFVSRS